MFKKTKTTKTLIMSLIPQLWKLATKRTRWKKNETRRKKIFKLQYVNNVWAATSHIQNIQESDNEIADKVTQNLNIYNKNPKFKGEPSFEKWSIKTTIVVDMDISLLNADTNNKKI